MYITESDKETILRQSEGRMMEIIGNFTALHRSGSNYLGKCPLCTQERGLTVTPSKGIFKCFKCNQLSGKRPIDYLMKGEKMTFPEALKYLADQMGISIEIKDDNPRPRPKATPGKPGKRGEKAGTFCARMLDESGLTYDDVTAKIFKKDSSKTVFQTKTFRPGTVSDKGEIIDGDDVIIEYFDLEGNPVKYETKDRRGVGTGRYREYFRVRWQFPDEHKDREGRPAKYKTPYGSSTYIYIPQKIRDLWREKSQIPHLFIQEGEKKAEKASKHGLPSIAVSGIQNMGTNGRLPEDLIRIIADCQVKNVTFLLDADWNNLSSNLRITDNVTYRPYMFFSAIRNYKDYMRTLVNRDLYVEIYFGYIRQNKAGDKQYLYFDDSVWEITAKHIQQIDYPAINQHHFWTDKKKIFPARLLDEPLFSFIKSPDGHYSYSLTEAGQQCHFLQFLINSSNFTWKKERMIADQAADVVITPEEKQENILHFLSKLCAIGFLALDFKDSNTAKAVIGMDGKQSEVGSSNGRSGKSLLGEAIRKVKPTVYINGKKTDFDTDQFIWNDVTEKTQIVFIDDVRPGFNFENQFANITGDWAVNYKGGTRVTFPFSSSPKEYICTNHALNGTGSSFKDRQWLIAFSDFYNETHKPKDDFGVLFFDEWEFEQWNLFWNLIAGCIQLYLSTGVVEAPGERLEQRIIRQKMGESFLMWAEEYYSDGEGTKLNQRISRKEIYDTYLTEFPHERKFVSPQKFREKLMAFCQWKGYTFNPQRYDNLTGLPMYFDKDGNPNLDDKSGGTEYFTIGNARFGADPNEIIPEKPF